MRLAPYVAVSVMMASAFFGLTPAGFSQNRNVEQVYVIFKTHLDIGYTDLSSKVTERYMKLFIPNALAVAERLKKENASERYVWTTGAWLIWEYLHTADAPAVERLKKALREGDIIWNAIPYTVESETMPQELYRALLLASQRMDQMFGKKTIAAKMTDVPGHSRSVITPLADAGIKFLHVGVNPASAVPEVPAPICRWRNTDGKEIILMYQGTYGADQIFPDGKTAVSFQVTNDNSGPHNYQTVKRIFAKLRRRYPNGKITASTLNMVAEKLLPMRDRLPVLTSEIGDTWIHGFASSPQQMREYRALTALFSKWCREKRLDFSRDETISFVLTLGQISEHTQGVSTGTYTRNFDKYDPDAFMAARKKGLFGITERSWEEKHAYIRKSLTYLPEDLQKEADAELAKVAPKKNPPDLPSVALSVPADRPVFSIPFFGGKLQLSGLTYRCYNAKDIEPFKNRYLRKPIPGWAHNDFGKIGIEKSKSPSVALPARVSSKTVAGGETVYTCGFNLPVNVDPRLLPPRVVVKVAERSDKNMAEIELTLYGKPAVRYPEAYWLSFDTSTARTIVAEKIGQRVDLSDVVRGGARNEHGIDRYVEIIRKDGGVYRIESKDALLVGLGRDPGLNFTKGPVRLNEGLHFNLCNNLWGTNFRMWNEGTLTYRFIVRRLRE